MGPYKLRNDYGDFYVSGGAGAYRFVEEYNYTSEKYFVFNDENTGKPQTGTIDFRVRGYGDDQINFAIWFSPLGTHGPVKCNVKSLLKYLPGPLVNRDSITSLKQLPTLYCSYDSFFKLLDMMGESWDRWSYKGKSYAKKATKMVVKDDFFHKKKNLKGYIINSVEGLFVQKIGDKKEEYLMCKFNEDIGGSCLDGASPKRDYLFMPKKSLASMPEEETKKEVASKK